MKMKFGAFIFCSALLAGASAIAAQSETITPVPFNDPAGSAARKIVNVVFADYIAARPGIQIAVSVADLDNDKVGEIFVRFVHSGSCKPGMKECRTVILKHDDAKNWQIVLDRFAQSIAIVGKGMRGSLAAIKTDDTLWQWKYPSYTPDIASIGKAISFNPLPVSITEQVAPAFGQGAKKLVEAHANIGFEYSQADVIPGKKAILVRMTGLNACGDAIGCPLRLLVQNEKTWTPIMSASSENDIVMLDVERDGHHDLGLSTKKGVVVMGWNGKNYGVADKLEQTVTGDKT